ncbi:MAG: hypothetical protein LUF27_08655 [Lachnospiraceae bacterium]|nr:hypothetical protein [Lachnospiraceae bacterium]
MKKVGVVHTSSNNAEKLLEIAAYRYPDVKVINFTDEALWEHVLDAKGQMTDRCHEILAQDFNRLAEAGCEAVGLLCSLVKGGIETVRPQVPVPVIVYDDAAVERAIEVTPDGGRIAVIAMKKTPLPLAADAAGSAAKRAGKTIWVDQIVVESAAECLRETKNQALADEYFIRYLREHQDSYSAYVVPQVPLSRIMPMVRDMKTPVFDSMESLLDGLVNRAWNGFEASYVKTGSL